MATTLHQKDQPMYFSHHLVMSTLVNILGILLSKENKKGGRIQWLFVGTRHLVQFAIRSIIPFFFQRSKKEQKHDRAAEWLMITCDPTWCVTSCASWHRNKRVALSLIFSDNIMIQEYMTKNIVTLLYVWLLSSFQSNKPFPWDTVFNLNLDDLKFIFKVDLCAIKCLGSLYCNEWKHTRYTII